MFEIKFGKWEVGTRPYGLKLSETEVFSDYIKATRYPAFSEPSYLGLPGKPPKEKPKLILDGFAFQVHLLGGFPPPENIPEKMKQDWEILSSLKADVIEKNGNNYTIYEIKQRLDVCTLGQLLTYKWLFEEVMQYPRNTTLVAVGDFIVPGLVQPLLNAGIRIHSRSSKWSFPPDFSASTIRAKSLIISQNYPSGR